MLNSAALRTDYIDGDQWLAELQSVCAENFQSRRVARQRYSANDPVCDIPDSHRSLKSLHQNAPSSRPQHGVEPVTMSLPSDNRTLGERIARALARRIGYGVTRKQLAHALNISGGTVDNLLSGRQDPSPRVFMALLQFFDAAFAHEVLAASGFTFVKLSDVRAADAMQRYLESVAELKAIEQARAE